MGHKPRAKGWCVYHDKLVYPDKFAQKCRTATGGKRCKHFTYKLPNYIKKER
jgi:hypothetical protein